MRVHLGAAPGVGKTYKMLEEGHRRRERGTDVVVGYVETHGREQTEAMIKDLEVLPRRTVHYRGTTFTEMDVDAVIARGAEVVLVDELAHTNVPGSRNAKRWQDIEELLDAGMTVMTTVNVQHLESINDIVRQITGVPQRETVPDEVVRRADAIELVDMAPEAIRRRMAHGNIYKPEKIDAALGNYFRVGNLTALRELALLWLADKVDDELENYRAAQGISDTWEARERVLVALTGGPEGETLIRRAARLASRSRGPQPTDLLAVHVARNDGLSSGGSHANLVAQRTLVEDLGGTYHQVVGNDIPKALLAFAKGVNATELVLGVSRRGRLQSLFSPGVGVTTTNGAGSMDVHLVTHAQARKGRALPKVRNALSANRRVAGFLLATIGIAVLTVLLAQLREQISLDSDVLLYLAAVVIVALVGGLWPALVAALLGTVALNYYFAPPIHRITIAAWENILALAVFLIVAVAVSATVDRAARRTREAASAQAEAETLSTLAGNVLRGAQPLPALLNQLRETFNFNGATLLQRRPDAGPSPDLQHDRDAWHVVESVGRTLFAPGEGDAEVQVDETVSLALCGHPLAAEDRRVVQAFANQAVVALRQQELSEQAAAAGPLAEVDRMRTALLSAVSHDLRTPLASAKAAVGGLRAPGIEFSPEDQAELLASVEESLDRLTRLVDNLLDMSRLQAGALAMHPQPTSIAETVAIALDEIGSPAKDIEVHLPEEFLEVHGDPVLIERVLVNLLRNALRYSPDDSPPMIMVSAHAGEVETKVIDRGPGIPIEKWEDVFLPFQRLGDRDNGTGVGLGLALSRGLAEAMGGSLTPDVTPGGGLTMVMTLLQSGPLPETELETQSKQAFVGDPQAGAS
nr:sensor histidine kinase KdpD [Kineosporia babensis]